MGGLLLSELLLHELLLGELRLENSGRITSLPLPQAWGEHRKVHTSYGNVVFRRQCANVLKETSGRAGWVRRAGREGRAGPSGRAHSKSGTPQPDTPALPCLRPTPAGTPQPDTPALPCLRPTPARPDLTWSNQHEVKG